MAWATVQAVNGGSASFSVQCYSCFILVDGAISLLHLLAATLFPHMVVKHSSNALIN